MGRCPECEEWNTLEEIIVETEVKQKSVYNKRLSSKKNQPQKIQEIESIQYERYKTNILEFDRVLGEGITKGSITLLGGEPGIGKSTLLMEVCKRISINYAQSNILYVSGEESNSQIAQRCRRLEIDSNNFYIYSETCWQDILEHLKKLNPSFLVIDSIQTTVSSDTQSPAGSISQIREVTYELMNYAKSNNLTCFVVGHVTKEGSIAGPKVLEHMVDTVIYFEGDQLGQYRILRVNKNRFGNTNEIGIFEMHEDGLMQVHNPSQYFLSSSLKEAYGRSLTCILEGSRPIFVEIQALAVESRFGNGRRTTQGVDSNRLSLLVAVIDKYFEVPLSLNDIYLNVVGGIKLNSRESDLAIISSLLSSYRGKKINDEIVLIGEVGLTGEVRSVPMMETRLKELEHLNYKKVITCKKTSKDLSGKYKLQIIGIEKAQELETLLFS
jgi:DNA repair protein RadA/Sms